MSSFNIYDCWYFSFFVITEKYHQFYLLRFVGCGWRYKKTLCAAEFVTPAMFQMMVSFFPCREFIFLMNLSIKKKKLKESTRSRPLCYTLNLPVMYVEWLKQTNKSHHWLLQPPRMHHHPHQSKPQPSSISVPARALIHLTDRKKSFLTRMCVPRYNSISRPGALYLQTQLAPDDAGWACHKRSQQSANGQSRKMASIKWHGFML